MGLNARRVGACLVGVIASAVAVAAIACSSRDSAPANGGEHSYTCDGVCAHVVAQCSVPQATCVEGCAKVTAGILVASCAAEYGDFMHCVGGAPGLRCQPHTIVFSAPACDGLFSAYEECAVANPNYAGCAVVPADTPCPSSAGRTLWCPVQPAGCVSHPGDAGFPVDSGIGAVYCCP